MTALKHLYPELNDDGKLHQRFMNKRVNASKEGIEFQLTFDEFATLLREASIVSSACGTKGYHLARNGDTGPYAVGNCSFKHYLDNLNEKVISDKSREAGSKNIRKAQDMVRALSLEERLAYVDKIKAGIAASPSYARRKEQAALRQAARDAAAHKSYTGARSSQYGTFWITDGDTNKKWHENKGDIPPLFYLGRIRNF